MRNKAPLTHQIKRTIYRKVGRALHQRESYVVKGQKCSINPDYQLPFAIFGPKMRDYIHVTLKDGSIRHVTAKNLVKTEDT